MDRKEEMILKLQMILSYRTVLMLISFVSEIKTEALVGSQLQRVQSIPGHTSLALGYRKQQHHGRERGAEPEVEREKKEQRSQYLLQRHPPPFFF